LSIRKRLRFAEFALDHDAIGRFQPLPQHIRGRRT
jgi:hypothetical protein